MKTLIHPLAADMTVEGILNALSDPVRMAIYAKLCQDGCPQTCGTFLEFDEHTIPKSTLSQHLGVLRNAGLIISERKGVEVYNKVRCEDVKEQWGALIGEILKAYYGQVAEKCTKNEAE